MSRFRVFTLEDGKWVKFGDPVAAASRRAAVKVVKNQYDLGDGNLSTSGKPWMVRRFVG